MENFAGGETGMVHLGCMMTREARGGENPARSTLPRCCLLMTSSGCARLRVTNPDRKQLSLDPVDVEILRARGDRWSNLGGRGDGGPTRSQDEMQP